MSARRRAATAAIQVVGLVLCLIGLTGPVLAHGGSLGGATRDSLSVPTWLVVGTGGAAVSASFLLASFATDRAFVASLHTPRQVLSIPAKEILLLGARILGVVALLGVVGVGLFGPEDPLSNAGVMIVWAGWWAGFTMSTYLVGNTWPAVNPWRTLASWLPSVGRRYRWHWGAWPSVAGLLALIWLEVVSPLADRPRVLAVTAIAYTIVTLAGAVVYGVDQWFEQIDPVARVFRAYGYVAPVGTDVDRSLSLRLPGAALTDDVLQSRGDVAFVVALLWVTTFDGFVATPVWRTLARAVVGAGVPPAVIYPAALVIGFGLFLGLYYGAARLARQTAPTYVAAETLARRFAPSLLAIAAGYHLAHFLGYFLTLLPPLVSSVTSPVTTAATQVLALPGWFGGVAIAAVLVGHILGIMAAHATAFELFPGRLQAIRSQYPFIAVMILYTMASLWVVTRPDVPPPYI